MTHIKPAKQMVFWRTASALLGVALCYAVYVIFQGPGGKPEPRQNSDDLIEVSAFNLPRYSSYSNDKTRKGLEKTRALILAARKKCEVAETEEKLSLRECEARSYPMIIAAARDIYDVEMESQIIGGVYTDVITPSGGVAPENEHRVLINLHSGSFIAGARFGGQLESIPIAAIGKYRVVSVDYRMLPEHKFPAASIDVAAVYKELLKDYKPENIGIFGCSAGARLTGEAVAWFDKEGLPQPGAVAMLCSAPTRLDGDSNHYAWAMAGRTPLTIRAVKYWDTAEADDPLAFPGEFTDMLRKFPPSLLMTSTRDYSVSPMSVMHSKLVQLGVETEFHLFEGFSHMGFLGLYVPEAKQATAIMAKFFNKHLGKQ